MDTKPQKKICFELDTFWGRMRYGFSKDKFRRRGFARVIHVDKSFRMRHYISQNEDGLVHIPFLGKKGLDFHLPDDLKGMVLDKGGLITGVWVGNEPALVPLDPGLTVSPVRANYFADFLVRTIQARSAPQVFNWGKAKGMVITAGIIMAASIGAMLVISAIGGVAIK